MGNCVVDTCSPIAEEARLHDILVANKMLEDERKQLDSDILDTADTFETRMSTQTLSTSLAESPKGYAPTRDDAILKILNTAETLKDHLKLMQKTGKVP